MTRPSQPVQRPRRAAQKRCVLVAIVGGSGAGKSWLARRLQQALGPRHAARISQDDFYRDLSHLSPRRRKLVNFDHPRAIDWPCLEQILAAARSGGRALMPSYDFTTHCRRPQGRPWKSAPVVLVEGLWLLRRPALRRWFDRKIFIACPARLRLQRRVARDVRERGRTREFSTRQFRRHTSPMHNRFVAPQIQRAEVVLRSPVSTATVRQLARALKLLSTSHKPHFPTQ